MEVDLATALAGGSGSSGISLALAGSASAGSTTFTVAGASSIPIRGLLAIGAGTTSCELARVNSISGSTVTISTALANAHSTGDLVVLINGPSVEATLFGVKGDGSTDDHDALQWAIRNTVTNGVWLDCQTRTMIIGSPLVLPQNHRIENFIFKAKSTFAPAESNNAMLMTQDGNIVSVASADPSTDVITTSTSHGMTSGNIGQGIVFQGSSLPGGITAGKFYYVLTVPSTTTMTISDTSGGSTLDITSTGTGTAYCEVYAANVKSWLRYGQVDGQNVASLNGILISCQQNTQWQTVRADNFPGYGMQVKGQEANWNNIEVNNCGVGIQFDNMSFLYAYELSMFGCTTSFIKAINAGLISSILTGIHFETLDSPGTYCDFSSGPTINVIFDNVSLSGMTTSNSANVGFDMGAAGTICTYEIRRCRFPTATPSTSNIAVRDNYRGKSILAYTASSTASADREIACLIANDVPSAASISDAYAGTIMWGIGGKELLMGRQQNISPVLTLSPGSSQTADALAINDTAGTQQFGVTTNGQIKASLGVQKGLATPTYGATVAINARSGDWQTITATDTSAFTISAPTNPPDSSHSQELVIEILNSSGGAMGTVTWNSAFVFTDGSFTNPASTKKRHVRFQWNGAKWVETARAANDY